MEKTDSQVFGRGDPGWRDGIHRNEESVGSDLAQVAGMRVTIAGFPVRWEKGDGSIVRLIAIVDEGDQ